MTFKENILMWATDEVKNQKKLIGNLEKSGFDNIPGFDEIVMMRLKMLDIAEDTVRQLNAL